MRFIHSAPPIVISKRSTKSQDFASTSGDVGLRLCSYIQNKSPSAAALGDWFLNLIFLTGTASPNGWLAIIIVVIIVGEANIAFHKLAYYSTNLQPI
jgi:hypothetical protein